MKSRGVLCVGLPVSSCGGEIGKNVLAAEGVATDIHEVLVRDEGMAGELRFVGSPTIRINGRDVVGELQTGKGLRSQLPSLSRIEANRSSGCGANSSCHSGSPARGIRVKQGTGISASLAAQGISIRRLAVADEKLAQQTFLIIAQVFNEDSAPLGSLYLKGLLSRSDFGVFAALVGKEVVGGITGFYLPLTRLERRELFIYDLAVKVDWQRKGIGRALFDSLRQAAAAEGIGEGFVLADDEDTHALDFYRALGASASPVTAFSFTTLGRRRRDSR